MARGVGVVGRVGGAGGTRSGERRRPRSGSRDVYRSPTGGSEVSDHNHFRHKQYVGLWRSEISRGLLLSACLAIPDAGRRAYVCFLSLPIHIWIAHGYSHCSLDEQATRNKAADQSSSPQPPLAPPPRSRRRPSFHATSPIDVPSRMILAVPFCRLPTGAWAGTEW